MSTHSTGSLFVVATPIGNLDDLTPRATQVLAQVDLIAAEDTRHTGRLLMHIGCKTRLMALHDHNEEHAAEQVIGQLKRGGSVALVSDAGTPLVSDPGFRLVNLAQEEGLRVIPIPGASALTAALSVAGIATDRFCFEGFLPPKKAARLLRLHQLQHEPRTLLFYESVHRIEASIADMSSVFGTDRPAFIARELTKLHEQCCYATLGGLSTLLADGDIVRKGEFVVVVDGDSAPPDPPLEVDRLLQALVGRLSAKDAAQIASEATGLKRNPLYARLLQLQKKA